MTLPLFLVAVLGLIAACVMVVGLIVWRPGAHPDATGPGWSEVGPLTGDDWCEHENPDGSYAGCPLPATHELVGALSHHGDAGGHSAMVASFCAEHAPPAAVRVR